MNKTYQNFRRIHQRFGTIKAFFYLIDLIINRFLYFDCWSIIILPREEAVPPRGIATEQLSARFATFDELINLQQQGTWNIDQDKLSLFKQGDRCLLSCVNDTIGGYTWAHAFGFPEVKTGLKLKIPSQYVYNYAGFTLPKFRGMKLQPYRHYMLLNQDEWKDKKGLLGYVKYINWSSKRGQKKSGYRSVGLMWLVRFKDAYFVYYSKKLRQLGISHK